MSQPFDPKKITPWVKGEITNLKKSPSVIEATKKAEQWALDEGRRLDANSVVRGLHYTKQALDDAIEGAKPQEAMRLKGLKTRITGLLDRLTDGEYSQASSVYAELSKPINQMQVGQELLKRTQPNPYLRGTEVGIRPDAFGRAMGQPDQVARAATGYGKASMERTMTPEQQATLRELGRQFAGRSFADAAGRAAGSNTAQNLVSENYMRQLMGPMGLPQGWAEGAARSTLAKTLLRPVQWATRLGEEQVMPKLADILADPARAASMMAAAQQGTIGQRVGMMLDPFSAPLAVGYTLPSNR